MLNDIVFFSTYGYNGGIYYGCYNNTFGYNCARNTFGTYCHNNTFGIECADNIFGDGCYNNTFGNNCCENIFGDFYYYNTFGSGCSSNSFMYYSNNDLISYVSNINYGNDVSKVILSLNDVYDFHLKNISVSKGFNSNSDDYIYIILENYIDNINQIIDSNAELTVCYNSYGDVCIFCVADLYKK
jgi:hypothetical protein